MKLKFGPVVGLLVAAMALSGGLLVGLRHSAEKAEIGGVDDAPAVGAAGNGAAMGTAAAGSATGAAGAAGVATGARPAVLPAGFKPAEPAVAALFAARFDDLDQHPRSLAEFAGRTVVVNFWATWCTPCVGEMPGLQALSTDLAPAGVTIVGIAIDSPQAVRDFRAKLSISYPILLGAADGTEHARALGDRSGGLPYTVVIGPDGAVRDRHAGRLDLAALRASLVAPAR